MLDSAQRLIQDALPGAPEAQAGLARTPKTSKSRLKQE